MSVQVDEAGGHDQAVGVQRLGGVARVEPAVPLDLGDLAIGNADVAGEARGARAVDDRAALYQYVEFGHEIPPCGNARSEN